MTKLDWPSREDHMPGQTPGVSVPSPFVAQGVRDALRTVYDAPRDTIPAEFMSLLDRLR